MPWMTVAAVLARIGQCAVVLLTVNVQFCWPSVGIIHCRCWAETNFLDTRVASLTSERVRVAWRASTDSLQWNEQLVAVRPVERDRVVGQPIADVGVARDLQEREAGVYA